MQIREHSGIKSRLFVGGLPGTTTSAELRLYFEGFDVKLISIDLKKRKLNRDESFKVCKGYGYITLRSMEDTHKLLKNAHYFKGRVLDLEFAHEEYTKRNKNILKQIEKIHVSNLSPETTDKGLFDYFSTFGRVKKAFRIREYQDKKIMPYGYVYFGDSKTANKVIGLAREHKIVLDGNVLSVKLYMSKDMIYQEHKTKVLEAQGHNSVYYMDRDTAFLRSRMVPQVEIHPQPQSKKSFHRQKKRKEPTSESFNQQHMFEGMKTESRDKPVPRVEVSQPMPPQERVTPTKEDLHASPEMERLLKFMYRNEENPKIDAIIKAYESPCLEHNDDNVVFRVSERSKRRIIEIPTIKKVDNQKDDAESLLERFNFHPDASLTKDNPRMTSKPDLPANSLPQALSSCFRESASEEEFLIAENSQEQSRSPTSLL